MIADLYIEIPGTLQRIYPESKLKLGRFSRTVWTANYGWFQLDGERPWCGWYLVSDTDSEIKPLLKTDLVDCYSISTTSSEGKFRITAYNPLGFPSEIEVNLTNGYLPDHF